MKTLDLSLYNSDSNAMCALKYFITEFINHKCIKIAMDFANDCIDNETELNEFNSLLNEFKNECMIVTRKIFNDDLKLVEIKYNRTQIDI